MLQIQIDEEAVKALYQKAIDVKLQELEQEKVYWDTKELRRRTCMSWNTIQDTFFFEKDFPKVKVGGKWYFPAKETEEFLTNWLNERR